jgi:hypothetical protein
VFLEVFWLTYQQNISRFIPEPARWLALHRKKEREREREREGGREGERERAICLTLHLRTCVLTKEYVTLFVVRKR